MKPTLLQVLYEPQIKLPIDLEYYWQLLNEMEKSKIHAQALFILKQNGRFKGTPAFFQQALHEKFQSIIYQNILMKNQTDRLLCEFERGGLDVIPLKGTSFSEKHFGHIGARPTSDIDLLIKANDMEEAKNIVKRMGYAQKEKQVPNHFHTAFSKELPGSEIPLTVELHWDLLKKDTANLEISEFWKEAYPIDDSVYVKQLSDYHLFYMICLHGWRHNMDSLKYFIDIIQLILNLNIDYKRLIDDAKRHKTKKRTIRTLSIVYEQLPILQSINEFTEKIPTLYNQRNSPIKKYADFIDYSFLSFDSPKHSIIEIYHMLSSKY
ncbi:nucleotidyltransferase family protein [Peribacillus muralis]|uniref:nucleotidyltransferase family protein n=1 Tax=Peribacillus muralis TaxID=264697 RepID=UPI001F4E83AD|nr:nucleotidyltransferase family protein [Peribacillus muralis]MCK1993426.1 nucleotidyltransferase family protein [Peribacillus muralis]MCK2014286.1 nucleotidyltransferase family protein [Peribacillus muralis]